MRGDWQAQQSEDKSRHHGKKRDHHENATCEGGLAKLLDNGDDCGIIRTKEGADEKHHCKQHSYDGRFTNNGLPVGFGPGVNSTRIGLRPLIWNRFRRTREQ